MKMNNPPFLLFHNAKIPANLLFTDPLDIICARNEEDFWSAFLRLDKERQAGHWLAGYIAYEAGVLFEKRLRQFAEVNRDIPLLCFGVFKKPASSDHDLARPRADETGATFLSDLRIAWHFDIYRQQFHKLQQALQRGDCFQGNLTFPITARWSGDPLSAFWALMKRQPVRYGAFVTLAEPIILSCSPELFFTSTKKAGLRHDP